MQKREYDQDEHMKHIGTTHQQNDNSNQEFHKAASSHPYSSTSTPQTSRELGHNKPKVPVTYMEQTHKTIRHPTTT